jgi:hypothetical protein
MRLYLKSKKGWGHGSNGSALALPVQTKYHKKKKKSSTVHELIDRAIRQKSNTCNPYA